MNNTEDNENMSEEQQELNELLGRYENCISENSDANVYFESDEIEDLFHHFLSLSDLKNAENIFNIGSRLHPDDEDIKLLRVALLTNQNHPQEALEALEELNMRDDLYWRMLKLNVLSELNRLDELKSLGDEILKEESDPDAMALEIADFLFENEQYETSLYFINKGLAYSPQNSDLLYAKAINLGTIQKTKEALEIIEPLLDDSPYNARLWQAKATMLVDLERYEESIEAFDYAIAINPSNETLHLARIKTLIAANREEEAIQDLEQFIKDFPKLKPLAQQILGDIYFWKKQYRTAVREYKKGFSNDMFLPDSVARYMDSEIALHHYSNVIRIGEQIIKAMPEEVPLLERMADAYYAMRLHRKALSIMHRCAKLAEDSPYLWLRYGSMLLDRGNYKQAYTAIRKACKLDPNNYFTYLMLALACFLKKDLSGMFDNYMKASALSDKCQQEFSRICPPGAMLLEEYFKNENK